MEEHIASLQRELDTIRLRNKKVEEDKAWETSLFRRLLVATITYIIASLVMYSIGVQNTFLNALVPTTGYLLSTLSLPFVKRWWLAKSNEKK